VRGDAAHAVLAFVARELGDPGSVWDAADRARPADYGPYGFALQASDTLGDALARAARFFPTVGTTAELSLSVNEKTARIMVRRSDGAKSIGAQLGTQYIAGQVVRLIAVITGERVRARAILVGDRRMTPSRAFAPSMSVEPILGARFAWIEIERVSLDVSLPRRDPDLARYFDVALARDENPTAAMGVRRVIEQAITFRRSIAEDDVARVLGLGPRTLRRRLAAERTTLREILDRVRLEILTDRLRQSQTSLAELALQLGFSDQTALSRAFRRWTGESPAQFRRAAVGA
jgi:AraC-like DNA-binding protein